MGLPRGHAGCVPLRFIAEIAHNLGGKHEARIPDSWTRGRGTCGGVRLIAGHRDTEWRFGHVAPHPGAGGSVSSLAGQWLFAVDAQSRALPGFTFTVAGVGTSLSTGVWTPSNTVGAQGQLQAVDSAAESTSGDAWFVMTGNTAYGSDNHLGTFELNLTSLGPREPNQPVWQHAHGTLTATFIPEPGNGPTGAVNVTLNATF